MIKLILPAERRAQAMQCQRFIERMMKQGFIEMVQDEEGFSYRITELGKQVARNFREQEAA